MIITIAGTVGSGKSTVGRIIAKRLGLKHYSIGDLMREMAEQRKISLMEISKLAEKDRSIDEELDQRQISHGMEEDDFVIDGRLSFHFIPKSFKIFLDADELVRAKRVLADNIRKEHNINLNNTVENMKRRVLSEKKRYRKYYKINPYSKKFYDLIVDTTKLSPNDVADTIIDFVENAP
jgi:cytidylate kinase